MSTTNALHTERKMWIAPLLPSDWEETKTTIQRLNITPSEVNEKHHRIYASVTREQLNALAHERRLCCGFEPPAK